MLTQRSIKLAVRPIQSYFNKNIRLMTQIPLNLSIDRTQNSRTFVTTSQSCAPEYNDTTQQTTNPTHQTPPKKQGKLRTLIARYGKLAIGIYVPLYLGSVFGSYFIYRAYDNFGMDPFYALDYFKMRDSFASMFGFEDPASMDLKDWHKSAVFAYLTGEVTELVRIPLVVYITPKIHQRLYGSKTSNVATTNETHGNESTKNPNHAS